MQELKQPGKKQKSANKCQKYEKFHYCMSPECFKQQNANPTNPNDQFQHYDGECNGECECTHAHTHLSSCTVDQFAKSLLEQFNNIQNLLDAIFYPKLKYVICHVGRIKQAFSRRYQEECMLNKETLDKKLIPDQQNSNWVSSKISNNVHAINHSLDQTKRYLQHIKTQISEYMKKKLILLKQECYQIQNQTPKFDKSSQQYSISPIQIQEYDSEANQDQLKQQKQKILHKYSSNKMLTTILTNIFQDYNKQYSFKALEKVIQVYRKAYSFQHSYRQKNVYSEQKSKLLSQVTQDLKLKQQVKGIFQYIEQERGEKFGEEVFGSRIRRTRETKKKNHSRTCMYKKDLRKVIFPNTDYLAKIDAIERIFQSEVTYKSTSQGFTCKLIARPYKQYNLQKKDLTKDFIIKRFGTKKQSESFLRTKYQKIYLYKIKQKQNRRSAAPPAWVLEVTEDGRYIWRPTIKVDKQDVEHLLQFIVTKPEKPQKKIIRSESLDLYLTSPRMKQSKPSKFFECPSIVINTGTHGKQTGMNAFLEKDKKLIDLRITDRIQQTIEYLLRSDKESNKLALTPDNLDEKIFINQIEVHKGMDYSYEANHTIDTHCHGAHYMIEKEEIQKGKYFKQNNLHFLHQIPEKPEKFWDSHIITRRQQQKIIGTFFQSLGQRFQAKLLYRAEKEDFSVGEYLKRHGKQENTLIICQTSRHAVIGGFTPVPHFILTPERRIKIDQNKNQQNWVQVPDKSKTSFIFTFWKNDNTYFSAKFGLEHQYQQKAIRQYEGQNRFCFGDKMLMIENQSMNQKTSCRFRPNQAYGNSSFNKQTQSIQKLNEKFHLLASSRVQLKNWQVWQIIIEKKVDNKQMQKNELSLRQVITSQNDPQQMTKLKKQSTSEQMKKQQKGSKSMNDLEVKQ